MHVAASDPRYTTRDQVPAAELDKEREIMREQLKNDPKNANKPDDVLSKIIVTDWAIPPLLYVALRFSVVAVLMLPWLWPIPRPAWRIVAIALTLFLALFLRITQIAGRANDSYSSLVAFGLMASWFVHVLVNVGMTLNLMPITGIPLPFFSYGGSFMLASWLAVGVLMRISGEGRGKAAFRAS